jgi:hypothetical protein
MIALTGCAGMINTEFITGACAEERDRCVEERCGMVKDSRECTLSCDFEGRMCERRQGSGGTTKARMGDEKALLVDLFGKKMMHSKGVTVTTQGEITSIPGGRALAPGAFMTLAVTLPPKLRQAELSLTHQPGGAATFLTVTVGEKALLGRYSPPRAKAWRTESFDFSTLITQDAPTAQTVNIVIFNNNAAGSKDPYHLAGIQVFYKAMEDRGSAPNVE